MRRRSATSPTFCCCETRRSRLSDMQVQYSYGLSSMACCCEMRRSRPSAMQVQSPSATMGRGCDIGVWRCSPKHRSPWLQHRPPRHTAPISRHILVLRTHAHIHAARAHGLQPRHGATDVSRLRSFDSRRVAQGTTRHADVARAHVSVLWLPFVFFPFVFFPFVFFASVSSVPPFASATNILKVLKSSTSVFFF